MLPASLRTQRQWFLIGISAILMSLSFHPIHLHFLAWFGLVPLIMALENTQPRQAFVRGVAFGFLFSMFTLFWIVFLQIETNIKLLIIGGLILLYSYIGLYFGVAALAARRNRIWAMPFAIVALEYVRGIGEIGFPWLSFGYTQARYPVFIQQAAVYGVYGVSFWIVLLNVAVYHALRTRKVKSILIAIVIFVLPILYGATRPATEGTRRVQVGIVQPNIDPNLKFSRELRYKTFERLIELSLRCVDASVDEYGKPLDIIVWPETATPVFLKSPGRYKDLVTRLSDRLQTQIFTGTAIYDSKDDEIFNGAVLIEPVHGIRQEYRKLHLVPFGEHIPFDRQIPWLRTIDFGEGDYTPGTEHTVFDAGKFRFSCLICFESIFPGPSRASVNRGAEMLVNITNDGWFGELSGAQQHNSMAIFRSVENGVVLLRSANTGISMVVDQRGRVLIEKPLFEEETIVQSVVMDPVETPYRTIGDLVPLLCLAVMALLMTVDFLRGRSADH